MTEVAANYSIKMNEIAADGFQSAEVEDIMKAAGDDTIWKSIQGLNDDNDSSVKAIVAGQNANLPNLVCVPPDVIEMAKFSVQKYNEIAGTSLVFIKVHSWHKLNPIFGTYYAMIIATQDCVGTYKDKALALRTRTGKKRLIRYVH